MKVFVAKASWTGPSGSSYQITLGVYRSREGAYAKICEYGTPRPGQMEGEYIITNEKGQEDWYLINAFELQD